MQIQVISKLWVSVHHLFGKRMLSIQSLRICCVAYYRAVQISCVSEFTHEAHEVLISHINQVVRTNQRFVKSCGMKIKLTELHSKAVAKGRGCMMLIPSWKKYVCTNLRGSDEKTRSLFAILGQWTYL